MYKIFTAMATVMLAGSASAAGVGDDMVVAKWMCASLKPGFDAAAAIKSFPLEPLSDPAEMRTTGKSLGSNTTSVSLKAQGGVYEVAYRYQVNEDNVNAPYGFSLQVTKKDNSMAAPNAKPWVHIFGKPQQRMTGWQVFAGPPMAPGLDPGFYFGSSTIGWPQREADWMYPNDIKFASDLCSKLR